MYCMSSALTVCQSSANSSATSLIAPPGSAGPHRTQSAWCRADCPPESRAVPASPCQQRWHSTRRTSNSRNIRVSPHERSRTRRTFRYVPPLLDTTATAARRFFERRLRVITRAFGSPKIPRTVCSASKLQGKRIGIPQPPTSLQCSCHPIFMANSEPSRNAKVLRNPPVCRAFSPKITHSFTRST